jgi:uncharacterized membrane protein (UPF0127 family)
MPTRVVRVLNASKGTCVGDRIEVADTSLSRFVGLLGRRGLLPGQGLLILPSNGVHTLGMLFSIDVVFLDEARRVLRLRENLRPFRITTLDWRAESVLELPVSTIRVARLEVGDLLAIHDQPLTA